MSDVVLAAALALLGVVVTAVLGLWGAKVAAGGGIRRDRRERVGYERAVAIALRRVQDLEAAVILLQERVSRLEERRDAG